MQRRLRIGIAAGQTLLILGFSIAFMFDGGWPALLILVPAVAISAFQTWLRYSRNQPVGFLAAAVLAVSGKSALPPKLD